MIKIVKIKGHSMSPEYSSGDYLFLKVSFFRKKIKRNMKVVFNHPYYGLMVKRIVSINCNGKSILVEGIHSDSVSTEAMGVIPIDSIVGVPFWHVRQRS